MNAFLVIFWTLFVAVNSQLDDDLSMDALILQGNEYPSTIRPTIPAIYTYNPDPNHRTPPPIIEIPFYPVNRRPHRYHPYRPQRYNPALLGPVAPAPIPRPPSPPLLLPPPPREHQWNGPYRGRRRSI
ncbi:unnamed protein product [Bursaphelenchus xylophilus]|uniref:(pine wood nematode) hypothetical protein n=1 Tax=Bursaphelenchus xylophilus TaxID=6326 RepID=A0A1I7SLQ3_BURXY|nr:unnamed protein product [Bursaphelenchus xylophilus]CAG9129701.1 unnamed protein product [Bursaphelenchus xylophilus]